MVRYNFVCRRPGRVVPLLFAVLCVPVTAFSYQIDIHVGSDDWGKDVVLDPWGNIVAAGVLDDHFAVLKRNSQLGQPLWQRTIGELEGMAFDVVVDAGGDVYACGSVYTVDKGWDFTVVKLSACTGLTVWEKFIDGRSDGSNPSQPGGDGGDAIALGPSGEVFAAGILDTEGMGASFSVVKFDAHSGDILWKRRVLGSKVQILGDSNGFSGGPNNLVVDAAGDPIAVGLLDNFPTLGAGTDHDFAVVKLDGQTSSVLWTFEPEGSEPPFTDSLDIALASGGHVVAGGHRAAAQSEVAIYKLNGLTGQPLWQHDFPGGDPGLQWMEDLYLGPWGEVIVGGRSDYAPMVVRLDGWTGAQVWQRTLGLLLDAGVVRRVESTYSGEVYGTGYILNGSDASSLRLLAFGLEANGQVDWLRRIGDGVQYGLGNALALDAAAVQNSFTGRLYITGGMKYPGPHEDDFTLVRLKAADGSGAGYVPSLAWKTAAPSFLVDERFYAGTYEDRIELEAAIVTGFAEDPAMRDFVWTDSAADLLLHAGRQVILGPLDEAEEVVAVEWICRHREPLESERQTLAFILLQSGGRGEPMAQECLGRGESRLEEAADTGCPDSQRSEFR